MISRSRTSTSVVAAVTLLVCVWSYRSAGASPITAETLTDRQVQAAMDAIIEELVRRRHPQRHWDRAFDGAAGQNQGGGYTALVAMALLYAGVSYQEPRLREVIDALEEIELRGTYAVSVRSSLWAILPPRFRDNLLHDAQWLMDGFSMGVGSWQYYQQPDSTYRDNSLRQFGTLALWDAARRGVPVPREYWEAIERGCLSMQLADGGWNYTGSGRATGSMTAAGLATLLIVQDLLRADESLPLNRRQVSPSQKAIDDAVAWMDSNFTPTENPGHGDRYFYYYLYGVERVGLAGGYKYFGGRDWYREGAAELIRRLCQWNPDEQTMALYERTAGDGPAIRNDQLAFALMFLSRGRMPSIINKLRDESSAWNNRPRDVPNLASWIAGETARHVIWQITDIDAPADQWLDAPMMYLASHEAMNWNEPENRATLERVKQYLDLGGLLFAVSEGSGRAFSDSIVAAGAAMYPAYQWRSLPADHWAYTVHQPVRSNRPRLRSLSNGVRDLIILASDGDLPATFQGRRHDQHAHYHTASNIYFYASEMDRPRPRLAALASSPVPDDWPRATGISLRMVRARHGGNWNPESQALPAFVRWLAERDEVAITCEDHPLADIHTRSPRPELVIVSGVEPVAFTEAELEAIRGYVRSGGVVLFETVGGMGQFTTSAERAVELALGAAAEPMTRHGIITAAGLEHGINMSRVNYRPYTLEALGSLATTPRLRGMVVDGHPRVLFSRDDISHALLDQPCWGINGYMPDSARRLLRNIVLHAASLAPEAATP